MKKKDNTDSKFLDKENIIVSDQLVDLLPLEFSISSDQSDYIIISGKKFSIDVVRLTRISNDINIELSVPPLDPIDFIETKSTSLVLKDRHYSCELVSHSTKSDLSDGGQLVVLIKGT